MCKEIGTNGQRNECVTGDTSSLLCGHTSALDQESNLDSSSKRFETVEMDPSSLISPISDLGPPQARIDAIRIHQQTSHILQPQPFRLRINRPAAHPPNDTNQSVGCKSPSGREELHHREKGDPDDKVTAPIGSRREARAQGSNGQGKELALLPGDVAESGCVPADIDDHGGKDDDGPRAPRIDARCGAVGVGTAKEFVSHGTYYEAQDHDGYRG